MPVLLAVNGTFQPYPSVPAPPKAEVGGVQAVEAEPSPDGQGERAVSQAARAAREAYGRTEAPGPRRPALLARDLMQTPVRTLPPEAPLGEAWALMKNRGFRHVPIVSPAGFLIGIVSDRDLLRYSSVLEHDSTTALAYAPVRDIMTSRVCTATAATEIREVAGVLVQERISSLPIVDEANRPVGILTVTDILRGLMTRAPLELWT